MRLDAPDGLEAVLVVPEDPVRTKIAREALPAEVPLFDAVSNVAHGALLMLGLARGDFDLVARGLHDRLHQDRRAHLFPKSMEIVRRATEVGALGATVSGAGPTVLVWSRYEQTGAVVAGLRELTDGWATRDARAVRVLRRGRPLALGRVSGAIPLLRRSEASRGTPSCGGDVAAGVSRPRRRRSSSATRR